MPANIPQSATGGLTLSSINWTIIPKHPHTWPPCIILFALLCLVCLVWFLLRNTRVSTFFRLLTFDCLLPACYPVICLDCYFVCLLPALILCPVMTSIIVLPLTLLFILVIRPMPASTVSLLFINKLHMDPTQPESSQSSFICPACFSSLFWQDNKGHKLAVFGFVFPW